MKKRMNEMHCNLQYSYYLIYQLQQAGRLNNGNQADVMETIKLKERVALLQQEVEFLKNSAQSSEVKVECKEECNASGFDVNEMWGTKNELVLMAMNYKIASRRQSPNEQPPTTTS